MIKKCVVPVAGLGTRLLSATKEQPKEMLPLFSLEAEGFLCLKPTVQQIFEELFNFGIREFYFVVGRGKRAIQDHFLPDMDFVRSLKDKRRGAQAMQLQGFYNQIGASRIAWVNQPEPRGFGDAVLQTEQLVGKEPFLVHAGDTLIISKTHNVLRLLTESHVAAGAEATLTLKEIEDPRQYGVAEVLEGVEGVSVRRVEEKPSRPVSKNAIMPLYAFNPVIFDAIKKTTEDKGGEIQLTDAIQRLIDTGHKVNAIKLEEGDVRLDIGTPETYWEALGISYRDALSKSGSNKP